MLGCQWGFADTLMGLAVTPWPHNTGLETGTVDPALHVFPWVPRHNVTLAQSLKYFSDHSVMVL